MKIIVPYRNRPQHLFAWQGIENVLFVEQADDKPFNRGKLLNIGAIECDDNILIFNDIDLVPQKPFIERTGVTQLCTSKIQLVDYLGGSTMFDRKTFEKIGGYNNDYFHRAEDNELRANMNRMRIPVITKLHPFTEQPHSRPNVEFDPLLWKKAHELRNQQDQLSICNYQIIEKSTTWLKVLL